MSAVLFELRARADHRKRGHMTALCEVATLPYHRVWVKPTARLKTAPSPKHSATLQLNPLANPRPLMHLDPLPKLSARVYPRAWVD
jgi:hypothetical protein